MTLRPVVVALLALPATQALAVDQGDWQLSAGATGALLIENDNPTPGLGGRLEGRYGLTDDSSVWAAVGSSWHPRLAEHLRASQASAGFALAFDVFRIVPFLEAGVSLSDLHGAVTRGRYLGFEAAGGAEYLFDRHWSAALVTRYHYLAIKLSGRDSTDPHPALLTLGVRIGHTF